MKKKQHTAGRRAFLKGSVKTLVAAPLALTSKPATAAEEEKLPEENGEPLPGDPGYRDPDTYGSLAD
jgi:hypothetical protein